MADTKRIDIEFQDSITIAKLTDPKLLDALDVGELEDEIRALITEHEPAGLVVSFENVTRCTSAVINAMLTAKHAMGVHGGRLALCEMRDPIRKAFVLCNLPLTICDTLHEAVDSLQST